MNKADVLKKMFLRPSKGKKLHPKVLNVQKTMTQPLQPLKYKLQEINDEQIKMNNPLGLNQEIPFNINRTTTGNIPVYRKYRNARHTCRTVVRNIYGDVDVKLIKIEKRFKFFKEFKNELSKVVSNSEILVKVGKVEIKGLHKESVTLWLKRLGF